MSVSIKSKVQMNSKNSVREFNKTLSKLMKQLCKLEKEYSFAVDQEILIKLQENHKKIKQFRSNIIKIDG